MKESNVNEKQKTIQQIEEVLGFSQHDSEALLVQATEVQTTDIIPIDTVKAHDEVDSTPTRLNNQHAENTSAILGRNAPR